MTRGTTTQPDSLRERCAGVGAEDGEAALATARQSSFDFARGDQLFLLDRAAVLLCDPPADRRGYRLLRHQTAVVVLRAIDALLYRGRGRENGNEISRSAIAEMTGLSTDAVKRSLTWLERSSILAIDRSPGRPNRLAVVWSDFQLLWERHQQQSRAGHQTPVAGHQTPANAARLRRDRSGHQTPDGRGRVADGGVGYQAPTLSDAPREGSSEHQSSAPPQVYVGEPCDPGRRTLPPGAYERATRGVRSRGSGRTTPGSAVYTIS